MKPPKFTKTDTKLNTRFVIEKGKHFAKRFTRVLQKPWRRVWFQFMPFMLNFGLFNMLRASFTIEIGTWHPNPDPNDGNWMDISKLIGVNFGINPSPHNNSYRIGIRPDYSNPGYFDLFEYVYRNGQRYLDFNNPICQIQEGIKTEITFSHVPGNTMYVAVYMERAGMVYEDSSTPFVQSSRVMSVLKPYHGGDLKAHQDWEIVFDEILLSYTSKKINDAALSSS